MLMDSIFPIKVAAVGQDGTVYVNRGKDGGLSRGQVLDIFVPEDPVIDPDTGVQLGFEESSAGRITITAVERARSKGTVTSGGANIARGQLLKRATDSDASPSQLGQGLGSLEAAAAQAAAAPGVAVGTRARLAVGKFRLFPGALKKESVFDKGDVNRLTNDVVIKLGKTNRFIVLERQEIDQILDEKAFEAFATGKDIEAYLGQLKGVDYLVLGAINDLFIKIESKKIPYLDEVRTSLTIDGEGDLRIVDVGTGAILAAEKVRVLKELSPGTLVRAKSEWINAFTKWAVAKVLEHLYPIKVLGLAGDGGVYINRGTDGGLTRGRRLDVMRVGEPMRDPDTGLLFGGAETKVAEVEITSVEPYRARVQLVDGQDVQVGDILRVSQKPAEKPGEKVNRPAW